MNQEITFLSDGGEMGERTADLASADERMALATLCVFGLAVTLLGLAGGLDRPTSGSVVVDSQELANLDEAGQLSLEQADVAIAVGSEEDGVLLVRGKRGMNEQVRT